MYPIICTIGPFTIYSYGLMLAIAFVTASVLAGMQARKENINPEIILNFSFIVFICGIIGARIFYVAENIAVYLRNPFEIIMLQRGGLSWFGGLTGGLVSAIIYLKKKNLAILKIFDLAAPFLALAQAVGRIGCLLNGCCFGKASRFGIYFPVHKAVLIPTQAYSSLILILIFIILRFLQDRPHKTGEVFFTYLLFYSLKRFFIEFWRAENKIIIFNLTQFQVLSIFVFLVAIFGLAIIKLKKI